LSREKQVTPQHACKSVYCTSHRFDRPMRKYDALKKS
jgi:hypothetical protein